MWVRKFGQRAVRQRAVAGRESGVVPCGRVGGEFLLDALEVGERGAELFFSADHVRLHPVQAFVEHGACGAAAVVADAEEIHHVVHAGCLLGCGGKVGGEANGIDVLVCVIVREVGENFTAIRRLPPEEFERELVGVVPRHLLRDEVVNPGALVDLGELPVIAEGIGVPTDERSVAVNFLEGGLPDEELADE